MSSLATAHATKAHGHAHPGLVFSSLGATGLIVPQAGFGGYRILPGVEEHERALERALGQGLNLLDTSSNYTDGGSETLMGRVLARMFSKGALSREQVVVVSKAGYIQGSNHQLSQERKQRGEPFPDLVEYAAGLEHCVHPEFLADQLKRSLERLGLAALDVFLLHNPEYYLGWAHRQGLALAEAREEYHRRLGFAFKHLESEVAAGRIGCYGVSSNTFVNPKDDPEFTSLARLIELAQAASAGHHFRVIQFPLNLCETGAVNEKNQPGGLSVLDLARERGLGVLINRPLNAMCGERLLRLADWAGDEPPTEAKLRELLGELWDSEVRLKMGFLLNLPLDDSTRNGLNDLLGAGQMLAGQWRELSGLAHWQGLEAGYLIPRLNQACGFLAQKMADSKEGLAALDAHLDLARKAFAALTAWHGARDATAAGEIAAKARATDPDWAGAGGASQIALRALRSTAGVSSVLVGMRKPAYVEDVLAELEAPVDVKGRRDSWQKLGK